MKMRMMILAGLVLAVLPSLHAEWCIIASSAAAKHIGDKRCGFATEADARAWANANLPNISGISISGSDNTSSSSTAATAPAAAGHEFDSTINQAISAGLSGKISGGDAAGFVGIGILGNMLFAPNSVDPAEQQRQLAQQQAQQQLQGEAQQLYNSGLWCLKQKNYSCAINEFQQALAKTPNDRNIINNLALARQKLKDTAVAAKNSGALSSLLGNAPVKTGNFDFDQLTHSSVANPNASALSLVNLDSDPNVVDLRGTTKTYVDPALLKNDSANSSPPSAEDYKRQLLDLTQNNLLQQPNLNNAPPANSGAQPETAKTKDDIDREFDAAMAGQAKELNEKHLPQHFDLNSAQSAPDTQTGIQHQKTDAEQTTKAFDQVLDQHMAEPKQAGASQLANTPQPSGQSAIVAPDENLKDAPASKQAAQATPPDRTAQSGQQEVVLGNRSAAATLKPADPVTTPGSDTKAGDQLLSAAATAGAKDDLTINYDKGGARKAGPLDFSTAYAMGKAIDPSTFSTKVQHDQRMIDALKQLGDLQAKRSQMETETKRLTALRNAEKDIDQFALLDTKVKQMDKDYQSNLKAVSDTTQVVEKLHRSIDDEIEAAPTPPVVPTK